MAKGNVLEAMILEDKLSDQWYERWKMWIEETADKKTNA